MIKKLMAIAVVGVFAAPAFAQTSNVTLYGRANLGIDTYRATGGDSNGSAADAAGANNRVDFKSRTRIYDAASRIGVRGVEDLGNGLRAIFQIESGANVDNGQNTGQGGQTNASTGFLASRDSFVGLDGGFGRVTFGRQSVFWVNGTIIQTGANYVNAEVPFMNGASFGRVNVGIARESNVVKYTTPTFSGFNASVDFSPQSEAVQAGNATTGGYTNGRLYAATLRWAGGPVSAQADFAERKSANGSTAGVGANGALFSPVPRQRGYKALVGFTYMPGAQISAIFVRAENKDVAGLTNNGFIFQQNGDDLKQNMFGISWEHTFGNIQGLAQFGQVMKAKGCTSPVGATNGCDQTKTQGFMVGARYLMSKRTSVYTTFNYVRNQQNAVADFGGGAITSANTLGSNGAFGADPRIVAVGILHNF